MSTVPLRITAAEQRRRDECVLEPIRTPGAVQPHGAFLAVEPSSWQVISASENAASILGREASELLGQHLSVLTGNEPLDEFLDILDETNAAANPAQIAIGGAPFDVILHRSESLILMDFEPSLVPIASQAMGPMFAAIHRLGRLTTAAELRSNTAEEMRLITGFDRVMIYHFHPDEHGEVVAEAVIDELEPYLGLHYPASDIPAQARELYLSKLSRVIADSSAEPVALTTLNTSSGVPEFELDLSLTELRAVSPHHRQFMRNMGQASTVSFSLVHDGRLIGMITCAHRTPRRLRYVVRQGLEILANQVALQLSSISALRVFTRQIEERSIRSRVMTGLTDDSEIPATLLGGHTTIFDLVPADGAIVRLSGKSALSGLTPSEPQMQKLVEALNMRAAGLAFITDSFALDHPELGALVPTVAGALVVPIGGDGDFVAWFRAEQVEAVSWLGDQSASNRETPLSPRSSFSAWTRDVRGISAPWEGSHKDARELGRDLDGLLFRRAESKLAHVALHDPLTGLPNRRRLMDRLDHALAKYARGEELAVLFVDLDRFKSINDSLGHDVGDAVLIRVAQVLLATVRAQDTVARIGGDEFIIVCENTTIEEGESLAERIIDAMRFTLTGSETNFPITASIGLASANLAFDASGVLKQADSAMYRAKARGGNRVAI